MERCRSPQGEAAGPCSDAGVSSAKAIPSLPGDAVPGTARASWGSQTISPLKGTNPSGVGKPSTLQGTGPALQRNAAEHPNLQTAQMWEVVLQLWINREASKHHCITTAVYWQLQSSHLAVGPGSHLLWGSDLPAVTQPCQDPVERGQHGARAPGGHQSPSLEGFNRRVEVALGDLC